MDLTPEERQRIYLDEKARLEARPVRKSRKLWLVPVVLVGFWVLIGAASDQPHNTSAASSGRAVGTITTVVQDTGWFSCGSTPDALDEMIKWATLKDKEEVIRTLISTGSTRIAPGDRVKILDYHGFSKLKIRLLSGPAKGVECWVDHEWLN